MPLEVNPAGTPAPLKHTSLVGEPARLAWIAGLSGELQAVNDRMGPGPVREPAWAERAAWLRERIEAASSAANSTDENTGIIEFGTQVELSIHTYGAVRAFTETSRPDALQRLRAADRQPIRGVGAGRQSRATRIWMPPLRGAAP
jgi:hypothetical protein